MNSQYVLFTCLKNSKFSFLFWKGIYRLVLLSLYQIQICGFFCNSAYNISADWYSEISSLSFPEIHNRDKLLGVMGRQMKLSLTHTQCHALKCNNMWTENRAQRRASTDWD